MLSKSMPVVALLVFTSRIFGLIRSMLLASFLGTTFISDAFTIAFKIPNLFRILFAEGSMTASFIPVFSEIQKEAIGDKSKESLFISRFLITAFLLLIIICILGIIFSPFIVRILYTFGSQPPELAVFLTRYMFFYLAFISLASIFQGILNANSYFAVPSTTPILLNVIMITALLFFTNCIPDQLIAFCVPETFKKFITDPILFQSIKAAFAVSTGVLLGGIIQLIFQLPLFFKIGYRILFTTNLHDPHISKIGKLMIPGLFGLGIYQINALIADPFVLAYLPSGCISALNYSNRLMEFTLGIFVVSLSTVMLPSLSKHTANQNNEEFIKLIHQSLKLVLFITIPATLGLIFLRIPLISLLFQSGLFKSESIKFVADAVIFHSLGIVVIGFYRIYSSAFYALKDTKTPVKGAAISLITNLILCFFLPRFMGIGGIAFASTLASLSNCLYLYFNLSKKDNRLKINYIYKNILLCLLASLPMTIFLIICNYYLFPLIHTKLLLAVATTGCVLLSILFFFLAGLLFNISEIKIITEKILSRLSSNKR